LPLKLFISIPELGITLTPFVSVHFVILLQPHSIPVLERCSRLLLAVATAIVIFYVGVYDNNYYLTAI
jgi:hypothetical protein